MSLHRIAVVQGDGIGLEVVPAAQRVVEHVAKGQGFGIEWQEHSWGSDYYRKHGRMMPVDAIERLKASDAILLGAVGDPEIPDAETLWGLLIPIRRELDQYINLRPISSFAGVPSPLGEAAKNIDLVVVRENVEGEYSSVGGRIYDGQDHAIAIQETIFSRRGIDRVARYALELARTRSKRLISATKSNGIIHTMPFWDEIVADRSREYPDVQLESVLIDALAARMVLRPDSIDVIVASNLFGDILSDLSAGITGSIGIAASANLNPEGRFPSLFEAVHGSAPDIAGRGIANPTGTIWSAALMLENLGEVEGSERVMGALRTTLESGCRTPDLGGEESTDSFTDELIRQLDEH